MKKILKISSVLFLSMFLVVNIASAHVTVSPKEVPRNLDDQKFTIKVPNEMQKNVTKVVIDIPKNVDVSAVEPTPNWNIKLTKDETDKITKITWTASDKGLIPNEFIEFNLLGVVSNTATSLTWKAYQTYSGGTVVKWIGPARSDHPASVTKVISDKSLSKNKNLKNTDTNSNNSPQLSLYLSIVGIILGVIAILFTFLKKKK